MQKIRENKVIQIGKRGNAISLPKVFIDDNKIERGDEIEIYRDLLSGIDALIIIPKKMNKPSSAM